MSLCDDLRTQDQNLQASLAAVDAAIDETFAAHQLQVLRNQQANLRAQISHIETLINQNCGAGIPTVALAAAAPALASAKDKAARAHVAAVTNLSAKSIAHNTAALRALGMPVAKATAKKKAR